MKAMGLEPNLRMLETIGDTVAALGGSEEVFEGIIRALGQIQAKGKASAEELMQLAERGVPAYQILQEKLGLTAEQVANIGNEGIEASRAIEALLEGMRERFGGNMERMSQSWEGMMSNLRDQWTRFMKAVGESGAF
jgi:tape measure domain-containing protein